ncbi:cytochrome P450 [Apiosordaria backusii]|uniref:Cytochrome P450 n=1 Tax=Apiosordaria backusii TaxID=314023 RepID=A0AA40K0N0_9PEZI|nr:cytochrome P450 [Apiosordaria backusii]
MNVTSQIPFPSNLITTVTGYYSDSKLKSEGHGSVFTTLAIVWFSVVLIGSPTLKWIQQRWKAWGYLFGGPAMIQEAFAKANGKPFEVVSQETRHIFISSPTEIKQLLSSPSEDLSFYAAARYLAQPQYTMHNFNWLDHEGVTAMGKAKSEGGGFTKAVRVCLTNNLSRVLPSLGHIVEKEVEAMLHEHKIVDGVRQSPIHEMITRLVVLCNIRAIFGAELATNETFVKAAQAYIEQTILGSEAIRIMPHWFQPVIGRIVPRWMTAQHVVYATLLPIVQERLKERELPLAEQPQHADCIQWVIDCSTSLVQQKGQSSGIGAERAVHELMAIWFGSVHAVAAVVTFAIEDLCLHQEYIAPLRQEIDAQFEGFKRAGQPSGLPLLDSFIKESARLAPNEALSTRRAALKPLSFTDSSNKTWHLAKGDWLCTPLWALNMSDQIYTNPEKFDGFRFVPSEVLKAISESSPKTKPAQSKPGKIYDTDYEWLMFGIGKQACPGRFYATATFKLIIATIVRKYDLRMVKPGVKRWWTMESALVPREVGIVFTEREDR